VITLDDKDDDDDDEEADIPEIKVLSKKEKEKLKKERDKVCFTNDLARRQTHIDFIGKEKGTGCRKEGR
jgi:hypothetical protein